MSETIYDAHVALHPLTAGFAEVADAYDRGRPDYAPAIVGAIAAELGIPPAGRVLDLAAGTGKLTRALLGVGPVRAAGGWSEPREIRITASQPASPERMVDYIASMSWVAALPEAQRAETLVKINAIVSAGETPSELPIHVVIGLTALT